jgi:lysophospholipase L1-like esterase
MSSGGSSIDPDTDIVLTFDGMESVTIPTGEKIISDEFYYDLPALSDVAITMYFGETPDDVTGHPGSRTTSYIQTGDATDIETMPEAVGTDHWYYIEGIEMLACEHHRSVITLGDSITDGRGSTTNGNNRWPDNLARRLQENWMTRNVSLINQGVGGNAVLRGGLGPTALDRFDRDVLDQEGIKWVIVLEGVNDIGGSQDESVAADLIEAYQIFIEKAHSEDLLIYGVPILPFGGSQYDSPAHEAARQQVNDWIRTSGAFDAVIDLDAAVRDTDNPSILSEEYDSGDHLHLSVEGYQRMADMIDLELFTPMLRKKDGQRL